MEGGEAEEARSSAQTTILASTHKNPNLFITLNPDGGREVKAAPIRALTERWAVHPAMDAAAVACQRRVWGGHQGKGGVWYAGAYLHWGFHEDGFRSGIEVARALLGDESIPLLPTEVEAFGEVHFAFEGKTAHVRLVRGGKG